MFDEQEYRLFDETIECIRKFNLNVSGNFFFILCLLKTFELYIKDSDDAYDMDGDDIQEKIEDTFRRVKIDDVVAKIMTVLTSRKSHTPEQFSSAVNYFSFIVDFYHDYAPTMKDIDEFAMMLVKKYNFNVTVLKACYLEYLVDGKKDEHGFPDIADDIETKSIQKLLEVVYKIMDCMNENFTINLIETDILNSLMKIMALPRS